MYYRSLILVIKFLAASSLRLHVFHWHSSSEPIPENQRQFAVMLASVSKELSKERESRQRLSNIINALATMSHEELGDALPDALQSFLDTMDTLASKVSPTVYSTYIARILYLSLLLSTRSLRYCK